MKHTHDTIHVTDEVAVTRHFAIDGNDLTVAQEYSCSDLLSAIDSYAEQADALRAQRDELAAALRAVLSFTAVEGYIGREIPVLIAARVALAKIEGGAL